MQELIAHTLDVDKAKINLKATHFEGLGFIGEAESWSKSNSFTRKVYLKTKIVNSSIIIIKR